VGGLLFGVAACCLNFNLDKRSGAGRYSKLLGFRGLGVSGILWAVCCVEADAGR
jgi:hypothetical protein